MCCSDRVRCGIDGDVPRGDVLRIGSGSRPSTCVFPKDLDVRFATASPPEIHKEVFAWIARLSRCPRHRRHAGAQQSEAGISLSVRRVTNRRAFPPTAGR